MGFADADCNELLETNQLLQPPRRRGELSAEVVGGETASTGWAHSQAKTLAEKRALNVVFCLRCFLRLALHLLEQALLISFQNKSPPVFFQVKMANLTAFSDESSALFLSNQRLYIWLALPQGETQISLLHSK